MDGSPSATNIDILDKYESTIRNECGGMTTDIREQNREKIINTLSIITDAMDCYLKTLSIQKETTYDKISYM